MKCLLICKMGILRGPPSMETFELRLHGSQAASHVKNLKENILTKGTAGTNVLGWKQASGILLPRKAHVSGRY